MKFEKLSINSCCGAQSIIFILEKPASILTISHLASFSFNELSHFTKNGIIYMENNDCIITGTIGQNKLTLKFKNKNIENVIANVENILNLHE